ncbi:MAG: MFS transporter [Hydrogenibacillus schlegelii]|uniref:MFS transporter n=1 Tax=Hydrogenibacillus schlegelii TaxID=1484 RepID=A0A947D2U9_HYDSH|nr:MFS transporter [Hydrogenibacillus schlegelii]
MSARFGAVPGDLFGAPRETPFYARREWRLGALGFMVDAFDVGLFSFVLALLAADWGLGPAERGLLGSANSLGMAVGALLAGHIADRWGRRLVFMGTLLLFSLGTMLSALALGFGMMLAFRFFIGLGLGGELPIAATYVSETAPPRERARAVVMAESFWAIGWLLAALLAHFIMAGHGWRAGLLLGGLPALLILYARRNLPESKAFLHLKTDRRKGRDGGGWDRAADGRPTADAGAVSAGQLFDPEHRRGTVTLWTLWWAINFAYYGMFLWLPSLMMARGFDVVQSFEYVLWMTVAQLPGYLSAAWLIERIGRRPVLAFYLLGTAVAAYGFGQASSIAALLGFGAALNFFNLGAWGALYAYTPELYPTALRARGAGTAAAIGRLGAIVAPYAVGWLLGRGFTQAGVFWLFVTVLLLAVVTLLLLGPETKSRATRGEA